MKQLQNDFTTPEQSRQLLELGVPAWTADCIIQSCSPSEVLFEDYETYLLKKGDIYRESSNCFSLLPAWSVGRLIEICKKCEPKKDYEQLCDELKYCKNYCVLIISHIIANLPIINFSKLEE